MHVLSKLVILSIKYAEIFNYIHFYNTAQKLKTTIKTRENNELGNVGSVLKICLDHGD